MAPVCHYLVTDRGRSWGQDAGGGTTLMRRLLAVVPLVILIAVLGTGAAQAVAPGGGDRWALVVGIDHFQGATRPNTGAVGDAEDVKAALAAAGFASDHIRVLTDSGATRGAIMDGLAWLASKS